MSRTSIRLLRTFSVCVLGLCLIEALLVDMNGCLLNFCHRLSGAIFGGTFLTGVASASVLVTVDCYWRALHVCCLGAYVAMLIPLLLG